MGIHKDASVEIMLAITNPNRIDRSGAIDKRKSLLERLPIPKKIKVTSTRIINKEIILINLFIYY